MEEKVKMIRNVDGKKYEQEVPKGLIELYIGKGWEVVEKKATPNVSFSTRRETEPVDKD